MLLFLCSLLNINLRTTGLLLRNDRIVSHSNRFRSCRCNNDDRPNVRDFLHASDPVLFPASGSKDHDYGGNGRLGNSLRTVLVQCSESGHMDDSVGSCIAWCMLWLLLRNGVHVHRSKSTEGHSRSGSKPVGIPHTGHRHVLRI